MRHQLRVQVCYPDVDGNWQYIAVKPVEDRAEEYFPVAIEEEVVIQGTSMQPGYTFDNRLGEDRLAPYCGSNAYGEAMFCAINEGQEQHGCYYVNQRDNERGHRAVCVEWELRHVIENDADLVAACRGESAAPVPRPVVDRPTDRVVTRELPNGRWCVETRTGGGWVATTRTKGLADALRDLMANPCQCVIGFSGGHSQVTLPYGLIPYIEVFEIDLNGENPTWGGTYEGFVDENGNNRRISVRQANPAQPTGAADVDRAIEAFNRRRDERENR